MVLGVRQPAAVPDEASINLHLLPEGFRELVRVLGFAAAMRLIQRRGGIPLRVPKRVDWSAPSPAALALLDDLGSAEALSKLVDWAGGSTLYYIPKYDAVARQLRHEQVRELRRRGYTSEEIARKTQYSARRVFGILGWDDPAKAAQRDLFSGEYEVEDAAPPAAPAGIGSAHNPFGIVARAGDDADADPV